MSFSPTSFLINPHFQTLYPSLFKKNPTLEFEIEELVVSDGDFLELFWFKKDTTKPVVIVLHGLGGSAKSAYIPSLVLTLHKNGFSPVVMHFRGCGTKPNNTPRSYHSGDTKDLSEAVEYLYKQTKQLYGIGFSLGANVLLKYLGEQKENSLIKKAMAVSPPMKLDVCSTCINSGFSRLYQHILLQDLKKFLLEKSKRFDLEKLIGLSREKINKITTFWEFDELYTAPIHGFDSAKEYYQLSSSFYYLKNITTKTLLLHAKDDPFMSSAVIPKVEDVSSSVTLEITDRGGHVGFVEGGFFTPSYYIDKKAVEFLGA